MDSEAEKRERKREKLFKRMDEVTPEQKSLVRFVDVRWEVMDQDEDGKWHRTGREHSHGLQIENRVYLVTGGPCKMVNRKSFRITKVYDGIPKWATEELKERYRRERETHRPNKQQTPPLSAAQQNPHTPSLIESEHVSGQEDDPPPW